MYIKNFQNHEHPRDFQLICSSLSLPPSTSSFLCIYTGILKHRQYSNASSCDFGKSLWIKEILPMMLNLLLNVSVRQDSNLKLHTEEDFEIELHGHATLNV